MECILWLHITHNYLHICFEYCFGTFHTTRLLFYFVVFFLLLLFNSFYWQMFAMRKATKQMATIRTCTDELVQHRDKHQATSNSANPPTVRNHKSLKLASADFGFLYCDFISFNAQINMRAFYTFYLFQHNTGSSSRWLHVFACEVFVHEMIEM